MNKLTTKDKVNIIYNFIHGNSNEQYSKEEVQWCLKTYKVKYGDPRGTKKNLEPFVIAKDRGYRKDFNDYCYDNNLADGRKTRNGKKESENSKSAQLLDIGLMVVFNYCALFAYNAQNFFLPLLIIQIVVWKKLGRRKGLIFAAVFCILFCQIAYRI